MIKIENLFLKAGKFNLKNINLKVEKGEYRIILGPTGSGKTLLMECLAGLKKINSGRISLNGKDAGKLPPEERNIGYLPQDYALFPFLNVAENIAMGLKLRQQEAKIIDKKINSISDTLSIKHLLRRDIKSLSGGEKQRVALARALAVNPDILLLDEPYSAIDSSMRKRLWWQMKALHQKTRKTIVHITHDLQEALALSETINIIIGGNMEHSCQSKNIFKNTSNKKVAEFLGICNIASAKEYEIKDNKILIKCGNNTLYLPHNRSIKNRCPINFGIMPEDIKIISNKNSIANENILKGKIISTIENDNSRELFVKIPDLNGICHENVLEVKVFSAQDKEKLPHYGEEIKILLPADKIRIFKNDKG